MARRQDYRIRHAFAPSVTTSSRVRGRAAGGWSEDLHARLTDERATCHPRLEPAGTTFRRAKLRARLRKLFESGRLDGMVSAHVSDNAARERIMSAQAFGQAWGAFEDASPALQRPPLFAVELEENLALLRRCVMRLNAGLSERSSIQAALDIR
jgi:hypothetical protein